MFLLGRTYLIKTFGCRVNQAESIQIEKNLQKVGFSPVGKNRKPDLVIINSCVVTQKAEKEVKQMARSFRRKWPDAFLLITGCGPTFWKIKKEDFETADLLVNNQEKEKIGKIISQYYEPIRRTKKD